MSIARPGTALAGGLGHIDPIWAKVVGYDPAAGGVPMPVPASGGAPLPATHAVAPSPGTLLGGGGSSTLLGV